MKKIQQQGFTIIELIVVIAIIAILASIVMVNTSTYIHRSKMARFQAEAQQMSVAMQGFYAQYNKWPIYAGDLGVPPTGDGLPQAATTQPFVQKGTTRQAFYPNFDGTYWGKGSYGVSYDYYYDDWSCVDINGHECDNYDWSCADCSSSDGSCAFLTVYNGLSPYTSGEYNINCTSCPELCGTYIDGGL